ncbi:Mitochondrial peptide methionine sulfoxide reductase [Anabarilius grahami]|uniref:peptide-methionine (S)-S-oxide reductase n=1 Tax=Anabarilius grahami TaxID=495550 RepID=A0A3N0Y5S3_ANAGA|nr:Mitochondrial peptide methionine sulfoxide reductase [Anabarilius grahami]
MGGKEKTVSKLRSPLLLFGVQSATGTCLSGGDLDPCPSLMRGAHYRMAQGNDHGTQYRSAIYTYSPEQQELAMRSKHMYQEALTRKGHGEITTEIREHTDFYYAEDYHQQYLHKALTRKGHGEITTEIREHTDFYYAEDYHQQYLHKVPKGYCGLKGTGVTCSFGEEKDEL